jgi:RNA polymerase sigma factor (sigma-70 family)
MRGYAEGSEEAFNALFARYHERVYGFFLRRTGSEARARDLFQELFLRLHRFRHRFDPEQPFAPWLFAIARRLLVDELRRRAPGSEVSVDDLPIAAAGPDAETVVALRLGVEQTVASLSPEQRRVLFAVQVEGRGYRELVAELGKSADALKQIGSRALRRLRALESPV